MKERDMQVFWGRHISKHAPQTTKVWELKFSKTRSIRFDDIKDHQRQALLSAKHNGLFHRITDQPWMKDRPYPFTFKKPFDCFFLSKVEAYVLVWFYIPRKKKIFIEIEIDAFLHMEQKSKKKSFTEEEVLNFGQSVKLDP